MFSAGLLAARTHGPQLVRQWVGPEVGQKQAAEEQEVRAVASTAGGLELRHADRLHVEVQDHHREDDQCKGQDQAGPRLQLALEISGKLSIYIYVFYSGW